MLVQIDLSSLGGDGIVLQPTGTFMNLSWSVSNIGDFNGDYIDDFAVTLPSEDGASDPGGAYIIYGNLNGLSSVNIDELSKESGVFIKGIKGNTIAIEYVNGDGDFNGDGLSDLIISTPRDNNNSGTYTLLYGSRSSVPTDLSTINTDQGFVISSVNTQLVGHVIDFVGDINSDGFDEILIGIRDGNHQGGAFVIYGREAGITGLDLSNLDPSDGFFIRGEKMGDYAGDSVSPAGDVNGDGLLDLIIGAPLAEDEGDPDDDTDPGNAYVIYGSTSGFTDIDLDSLTTSQGFVIRGDAPHAYGGLQVGAAGDFNGDGLDDLLVTSSQKLFVVFGKTGGLENLDLSALTPADGFVIIPSDYNLAFAESLVGGGDVNGDGYDDIIVGERLGSTGAVHGGEAYVIFGKSGEFGTINLGGLNDAEGFHLVSNESDSATGLSVSLADVNGDGFHDMLVGAPHSSGGGLESGRLYLVYGPPPTTSVTRIGTVAGQVLAGGGFADQLEGRAGDDRLFGNAGTDILLGEGGDDWINGGLGADAMSGGADNDTYVLDNAGDTVTENADEGTDTVETSLGSGSTLAQRQAAQYQLGANVENLVGTLDTGQGLRGNGLDNDITSREGADYVNASNGGNDSVNTADGRDVIYYGAALTSGDSNDAGDEGGDARGDLLVIQGDYSEGIALGADTLIDVEKFRIQKGEFTNWGDTAGNLYSYDITSVDANVAAGGRLVVQGGSLQLGEHLYFDGSAETDGSFQMFGGHDGDTLTGGAQGDHLLGRSGDDTLIGNGGDDRLRGGLGADAMYGDEGADIFVYAAQGGAEPYSNAVLESTGLNFDTIIGFNFAEDKIDVPDAVSELQTVLGPSLNNSSFDADLAAAVNGSLAENGAVLFTPLSGDYAGGTYLVVDANGDGSYQVNADFVIELFYPIGSAPTSPDFFM